MTDGHESDERQWAAEKRDFVADRRDEMAAKRDGDADERDASAAAREQDADEREAQLDELDAVLRARAAELGEAPPRTEEERVRAVAQRREAAKLRQQRADERDRQATERFEAESARDEATKRLEAATPTTRLAMAFASIALHLYEAEDFEEVLSRIVEVTASAVEGCEMASVTVRDDVATFRTVASTDTTATEVDDAQYAVSQGPCLDAIEHGVVYTPRFPDARWPSLGARPTAYGVHSTVSFRLAAPGTVIGDPFEGSLNAYAGAPEAFTDEAQEIGLILAAHASVAARGVREREAYEQLGRQLHEALSTRDVIGQAKGILMERLKVTPEDAFDLLRRSSQQLNMKLREVADRLSETGQIGTAGQPSSGWD
jgi:hypothetical protein